MVAKITFPKKVESALNYNEAKVQKGKAVCLSANGYLRDGKDMNFYQKLEGFARLNVLNERATTKTIHVSLNFSPNEKLPESKLLSIASAYMERIGFGEQPYLVYQHQDAGHPHLHIVSTAIRNDGSRINTHNIGRNQSETARKELENVFGLVKAGGRSRSDLFMPKPITISKVIYGKDETKRSIAGVVTTVFNQYKFCSLPEYNAALKQFNVVADRGKEDGRVYKYGGLTYRILDGEGNKAGVPIKASSLPGKPTLANLQKKWESNAVSKEPFKTIIRAKLDESLAKAPTSIKSLVALLEDQKVFTALRQNAEGRVYGITFVDNECKCVFNGSDLGKEYSAGSLQSRLTGENKTSLSTSQSATAKQVSSNALQNKPKKRQNLPHFPSKKDGLFNELLSAKEEAAYLPQGLLKKKRKKRRKGSDT